MKEIVMNYLYASSIYCQGLFVDAHRIRPTCAFWEGDLENSEVFPLVLSNLTTLFGNPQAHLLKKTFFGFNFRLKLEKTKRIRNAAQKKIKRSLTSI